MVLMMPSIHFFKMAITFNSLLTVTTEVDISPVSAASLKHTAKNLVISLTWVETVISLFSQATTLMSHFPLSVTMRSIRLTIPSPPALFTPTLQPADNASAIWRGKPVWTC